MRHFERIALVGSICFLGCGNPKNVERNPLDGAEVLPSEHSLTSNDSNTSPKGFTRDNLNAFLEKPFDLHTFKKVQGMANSGGSGKEAYFFRPQNEGMYYRYFLFSRGFGYIGKDKNRRVKSENGLVITVYKNLGPNRYQYLDTSETLIQVEATMNVEGLPELAFIGLRTNTVHDKLGVPDIVHRDCEIYQHKNYHLILKTSANKVVGLQYIRSKDTSDILNYPNIFAP